MEKRWITFDLDGTLMQNPFMKWVFPEIVATIQEELDKEEDVWKLILDEHLKRMTEGRLLEAYNWDDIVEEVLVALGLSIKINVEELVTKHSIDPKVYALEVGILDNLKRLAERGYSLAVVTNGYYKYQMPVMRELGLDSAFEEIITPEQCGYAKPHIGLLDTFQGKGKLIAHVGDRIDHDVMMANRFGITSVFISRQLPESVKKLPMNARKEHDDFLTFCKSKWDKENQLPLPFIEECIPDIVVSSVGELVNGNGTLFPNGV